MGLLARWRASRRAQSVLEPVPDELLGNVQRGVVAAIGALSTNIATLTTRMQLLEESCGSVRAVEKDIARLLAHENATRRLIDDQVGRLDQAIAHLRGQMTGGMRSPRGRGGVANDVGSAILEQLGPDGAQQLLLELAQRGSNGEPV